jgi:FkbM family methyltransferase
MKFSRFAAKVAKKLIYPLLPDKARLPFNYRLHLIAGTIEPELQNIRAICKEGGTAIDVGANIGLYSYRMARIFSKVYSFEINAGIAADLVAYQSSKIEVVHCGLSTDERDVTLYVPVSKGVVLNGWASIRPGNCPDTQEHITKTVHVRPLDSYAMEGVSFIKIDVEGHEIEVLKGASKTIAASRPVVLVEVKDDNIEQVSSFFAAMDYEEVLLHALCGVDGARENRIYRPRSLSGVVR